AASAPSGIDSRGPMRVRSCAMQMMIDMTAPTGGVIRETASTSFASLLACSMPGQGFPFARVRTDNARQSPQAECNCAPGDAAHAAGHRAHCVELQFRHCE